MRRPSCRAGLRSSHARFFDSIDDTVPDADPDNAGDAVACGNAARGEWGGCGGGLAPALVIRRLGGLSIVGVAVAVASTAAAISSTSPPSSAACLDSAPACTALLLLLLLLIGVSVWARRAGLTCLAWAISSVDTAAAPAAFVIAATAVATTVVAAIAATFAAAAVDTDDIVSSAGRNSDTFRSVRGGGTGAATVLTAASTSSPSPPSSFFSLVSTPSPPLIVVYSGFFVVGIFSGVAPAMIRANMYSKDFPADCGGADAPAPGDAIPAPAVLSIGAER